jgi:hypothetical protein
MELAQQRERIVILHGFAVCGLVMRPLQYWLGRNGFDATLWCYPSLKTPIATLAKSFEGYLDQMERDSIPYHIVAHSMGSIIARAALLNTSHSGLKRMVFLAPPIHGTPIGRLAARFLKQWFPPLLDLSDAESSFVNMLPKSFPVETGIVSARFDILVPMKNTLLADAGGQITINGTHNSLLASPRVARLVASFLASGHF